MPSFPNGPGVYVNETLNSNFSATTASGPAAVFFGVTPRGPVGAQLVTDWVTYKRLFGDLSDSYDLGYSVYHFFANGGRDAYVCRAVNSSDIIATGTMAYYPNGVGQASAAAATVTAVSEGTWGNGISVATLNGVQQSGSDFTTFSLIVKYNGTEVERWPEVSLDPDSSRFFKTIINTYSDYIRITAAPATDYSGQFGVENDALTSGTTNSLVAADWSTAFDLIDTIKGSLTLNAVGITPGGDINSGIPVITELVNKAQSRGDSFVIIDPDKGLTTYDAIVSSSANLGSQAHPGYCAHYAPCLLMVDPSKSGPGAVRATYPGGAIAGIMARIDGRRTPAAAPAGITADVVGALGLEAKLSDANIGSLYQGTVQVNSFKAVPGAGVTVHGTRTLSRLTPDKFIPARRTLNYLKAELKSLTEFAVFEPNDNNLWGLISTVVSGFLTNFYQQGGLKGTSPAEAYYIICDETNNTPTTIDQGYVNIEVGVSLLYPAEYLVINISQWNGGANSANSI